MDDSELGDTIRRLSPEQMVFDRFTLQRLLGRGGMGVVWLARDTALDRDVALKFLPESVSMERESVRDLKRETLRSLELTHPHIVRIFDFVQDSRYAAIAMEFIAGDTLASRKLDHPKGFFEVQEIETWVKHALEALDYAHTHAQIVHRDLKPANLMLNAHGDVKIADFGVAASVAESVSRVSVKPGSSGTPLYMSPQQILGEKPAVTDDLYSFGATIYELLTGKPPFYTGDIYRQIEVKVPPSIEERRRELGADGYAIPLAWETTIAACLAKKPSDRPPSAREMANRLAGVSAADLPTEIVSTRIEPAVVPPSPPPLGSPTLNTTPPLPPTPPPMEPPRAATPVKHFGLILGGAAAVAALVLGGIVYHLAHSPSGQGGFSVQAEPAEAELKIDGFAPAKGHLKVDQVKSGHYTVTAHAEGYEDGKGEFSVKKDQVTDYPIRLARSTGIVALKADGLPGTYELAGPENRQGPLPLAAEKLLVGTYTVVFKRTGWVDQTKTLVVKRGETANATASFIPGEVQLASDPKGATVYAPDGKALGVTPLTLSDLVPGNVLFRVAAEGYDEETLAGFVGAKQSIQLSTTLNRSETQPREGARWTVPGLSLHMVPMVAGSFVMGSPPQEDGRLPNERAHAVSLSKPFWLGETAVTQAQYQTLMGNNPSHFPGEQRPVESVSWDEAMAFCRKLTDRERTAGRLPDGYEYSLPTEAQWEYACRAGTSGAYAGDLNAMGWYSLNSDQTTHPVRTKLPNAWGLYDMHGNVMEWCADWYAIYALPSEIDPTGPNTGREHVYRGGSFDSDIHGRSAFRAARPSSYQNSNLGFRLALRWTGSQIGEPR